MKFISLAFVSLLTSTLTLAAPAPSNNNPDEAVAAVLAGIDINHFQNHRRSTHTEAGALAAAGARANLGTIPVHSPGTHTSTHSQKKRSPSPSTEAVRKIKAIVAAGARVGTKASKRSVSTAAGASVKSIDDSFNPIETDVKVIVARLSSKDITLSEVKLLIPRLEYLLTRLQAEIALITSTSESTVSQLDTRLTSLISLILHALDKVELTLYAEVDELKIVVAGLGPVLQGVLDIAVKVVVGLEVRLAVSLRPLVGLLVKLGLHIRVGSLRV